MHVRNFELAKQHLETKGYFVLGGFIAPSHDNYVMAKLEGEWIEAKQRKEMCELAVKDHEWLSVSSWDISQPGFHDFPGLFNPVNFPKKVRLLILKCFAGHSLLRSYYSTFVVPILQKSVG
jgi:hypothetical protein